MNKDDIDKGLRYMQGGFTKALLNAKFGMHVVDTDVNELLPNFIKKEVNKMDLTDLQQKAYDKVISQLNDFLDDIDSSIAIDLVDDLVDTMKSNHYQIGDTVYYYNRCKNQIEAYVVEAVAIKDKHIIYNYIYDSESVKGSYDEIVRYAIECIENDAHMKIEALKGGD